MQRKTERNRKLTSLATSPRLKFQGNYFDSTDTWLKTNVEFLHTARPEDYFSTLFYGKIPLNNQIG